MSSSEEEESAGSAALSPSDLFYKRVTGVGRALVRACRWCAEQDESGCEPPALSALITKVNLVILVSYYMSSLGGEVWLVVCLLNS